MHSIILLIQTIRQFDFFRSNAAGCFSNSVLSGVEKIKGNMHQYIIIFYVNTLSFIIIMKKNNTYVMLLSLSYRIVK